MVTVTNYGPAGASPLTEVGNSVVVSAVSSDGSAPSVPAATTTAASSSESSSSSVAPSYSAPAPLSVVAAQVSIVATSASSSSSLAAQSPSVSSYSGAAASSSSPAVIASSGSSSGSNNYTSPDNSPSCNSGEPQIILFNPTDNDHVHVVEGNSGATKAIDVSAHTSHIYCPGPNWAGAITPNNGTRHEFNWDAGTIWYDSDMEYGISNSVSKPKVVVNDNANQPAQVGEADYLSKINDAWSKYQVKEEWGITLSKADLLSQWSHMIEGTENSVTKFKYWFPPGEGRSTIAATNPSVVGFLQMVAEFNAYIIHGSVSGLVPSLVDNQADKSTHCVSSAENDHTFHLTAWD